MSGALAATSSREIWSVALLFLSLYSEGVVGFVLGAFFLPGIGMLHGVSVFVDDVVRVCVRFPWNTHYRVLHSFRLGWRIVLLDTYVA